MKLILNSRRDDFEDNSTKDEFYNSFVRHIGIPYSFKIRKASDDRSKINNSNRYSRLLDTAKIIINKGYLSKSQQNKIITELRKLKELEKGNDNEQEIDCLIATMKESKHILDISGKKMSSDKKIVLKSIFEIIYNKCNDQSVAENIVYDIIESLSKGQRINASLN